jgi:hypothetical protein
MAKNVFYQKKRVEYAYGNMPYTSNMTAGVFKGTLTRDFLPLFFHQTTPPRPLIHGLNPF